MSFKVQLSAEAKRDIGRIYRFIAKHESVERAEKVLVSLEDTCAGLAEFPDRGNVPKELRALGIAEYREAHCNPYRIVYRRTGNRVMILCVIDGRRDIQSLLRRRLLE